MATLLCLPLEILLIIATFLDEPTCQLDRPHQSPTPYLYALLLTNRKLHDLVFPLLFQNLCVVTRSSVRRDISQSNHIGTPHPKIKSLAAQLQRPDVAAKVRSLCLHFFSCSYVAFIAKHILRPELKLRSLKIILHCPDYNNRRSRQFNIIKEFEEYKSTLEELYIDIRYEIDVDGDHCGMFCSDILCRTLRREDFFTSAQYERLRRLKICASVFFQYTSRPWKYKYSTYEYFWLPRSLECLELLHDSMCEYFEPLSPEYLSLEDNLEDSTIALWQDILQPCYEKGELYLKTLILTFDMRVSDLEFYGPEKRADAAFGPRAWLKWMNDAMSPMGFETFIRLALEPPGSAYHTIPLRDVKIVRKEATQVELIDGVVEVAT